MAETEDLTGRINGWQCADCGRTTYAIHVAHGVTPFMIGCRATLGCKGVTQSMFYPKAEPSQHVKDAVEWEWYRQSLKKAKKAERRAPGSIKHRENGGLEIRLLTEHGRRLLRGEPDAAE